MAVPRAVTATVVAFAVLVSCDRTRHPPPPDDATRPAAREAPATQPAPTVPPRVSPAQPSDDTSAEPPSEGAIARLLAPWRGDLAGMIERRYIRMLVTFSKTNYFLDGAQQRGATFEAGRSFEEFLNARLKSRHLRVHVAFIPVSRDRLLTALAAGKGDIAAASLTITPDRRRLVDFAAPFTSSVREVVVTAADQPPVGGTEDLSGRDVYVRPSSAYHDSLVTLNASLRRAGKAPVNIVAISEHLEDEDILEMVHAGLLPATVVDNHVAELWSQVFDSIRVHAGATLRTGAEIAWALRRNTPDLREAVDAFVARHREGTLMFNVVTRRYYRNTTWITNAAAQAEIRKFQGAVAIFRRYGQQYDLPWLLVAALAYQESTIDQTKRSSAGAVGVMQIKPSTAAGDPINIRGVEASAEQNIHAGVKYLRFVADRYFKDEPMDRLNKGLFTIAAYNAGPARITQLRGQARRMGLDPNTWFGNVEVVAAREIGRETVQYVSNIYKYYVAYSLMTEQQEARRRSRSP